MRGFAAACLALAAVPGVTQAQVGCLPPSAPFAYAPPKDDPELVRLIDEEYQTYIRDTETYLNCLNAESARAREEYQDVLQRYVQFFGIEAGIEYDEMNYAPYE